MRPAGPRRRPPATLRRRCVPTRVLGDKVIAARPADGAPVVLGPTAALVWTMLAGWIDHAELERNLAEAFPDVAEQERATTLDAILATLWGDDLLEG